MTLPSGNERPSEFKNNLVKGDPVLEVPTGNRGVVFRKPRESSRHATVLLDNYKTPRRIHIKNLRLVVEGEPEDVPPIDGPA